MPIFFLKLTDEQGTVLDDWKLNTDSNDDDADAILPLRGLGAVDLCRMINRTTEIQR